MEYGAPRPLIDFGTRASLADLTAYTRAAAALGYRYLCANDHLLFGRPWLDGPTALAAVVDDSSDMTLATTVSLPVIRGPVQLAKTLTAIDILSDGRLVVSVGPGSSARDYAAVAVPFDERWRRFNEAIQTPSAPCSTGPTTSTAGSTRAAESPSSRGLRSSPGRRSGWRAGGWRPAFGEPRYGDGWLASAYNTTPAQFREGLDRLTDAVRSEARTLRRSRTRSRRRGCTSPKTAVTRNACLPTSSPRC